MSASEDDGGQVLEHGCQKVRLDPVVLAIDVRWMYMQALKGVIQWLGQMSLSGCNYRVIWGSRCISRHWCRTGMFKVWVPRLVGTIMLSCAYAWNLIMLMILAVWLKWFHFTYSLSSFFSHIRHDSNQKSQQEFLFFIFVETSILYDHIGRQVK